MDLELLHIHKVYNQSQALRDGPGKGNQVWGHVGESCPRGILVVVRNSGPSVVAFAFRYSIPMRVEGCMRGGLLESQDYKVERGCLEKAVVCFRSGMNRLSHIQVLNLIIM